MSATVADKIDDGEINIEQDNSQLNQDIKKSPEALF